MRLVAYSRAVPVRIRNAQSLDCASKSSRASCLRTRSTRSLELFLCAIASLVIRNVAAGSLSQRLGIPEGTLLPRSIIEYYLKKDELDDPWVTEEHITAFGWASTHDLDEIVQIALRVNDFLTGLFLGINIRLVDFKLEFGRLYTDDEMRIVVADEISPDNCRLWDARSNEKMDKDRFRQDLGRVEEGYQEVARRLGILPEGGPSDIKGPKTVQ